LKQLASITMPLSFSNVDGPPLVETVHDDDASFVDSVPDDDLSEAETEASISDYEGDIKSAPLRMYFGPKECLAIFKLPSDRNAFIRVCGREQGACTRNHAVLERAREGFYDTVASRKYVDGKLHTFQSKKERDAELQEAKAARDLQLAESAEYLASLKVVEKAKVEASPSGLEPRSLLKAPPTYAVLEEKVEPSPPVPGPRSSLKKASRAYVATEEKADMPPPELAMQFMMGALTDTLQGLRNDMQDLRGHVSPKAESTRDQVRQSDSSLISPPPPATTPPAPLEPKPVLVEPADWWYAVGKGKDGASGVFPSWAEASHLILGVSGSVVKKFRDYAKAVEFVKTFQASEEPRIAIPIPEDPKDPSWYAVAKGKHGISNVFQSWEAASEVFLGVTGAVVQKFKTRGEALEFLTSYHRDGSKGEEPSSSPNIRQPNVERTNRNPPMERVTVDDKNYRPPMALAGPDPSTKQSDKVFGLDLGSEWDLREALLPPDLPDGVAKGLANSLVDAVAVPGVFTAGSDESEGNEMALLGEAMEELVSQQGRHHTEGATKADLHWKSGKRTSLRQVKNLDMLRKRVSVLLKLRDRIIKQTIIAVRNACKQGGWQDLERIEAWAHGGYITRITRDALDYYLSLHQHLMGLSSSGAPWDYVKMELDHHVEELGLIRATADSRLQAILFLYAYLRDGQNKNWHSDSLQYKRNMDIFTRHNEGTGIPGDDTSTIESASSHCPKCSSNLHAGGRANCPWNSRSDAAAKKEAAKALRNLANAAPTVPP
jgi:hypothetical protein